MLYTVKIVDFLSSILCSMHKECNVYSYKKIIYSFVGCTSV